MFIFTKVLVGLGVFLCGMFQLESGIRQLSYAPLKKWLFNLTNQPVISALFGMIATAILQSSSMVSLLVLAFLSANLIPLCSAIGILLGANLGTTFTGWIVATIGFKLNLQNLSLPLIAISGFYISFTKQNHKRFKSVMLIFLGLGLLLFGLSLMKDIATELPQQEFILQIKSYSNWVFLIVGIALSVIIQSSSAVMVLTLAGLNAAIIQLPEAAAIIIGADLGTTSTTIIASISGPPIKKQLAFSQVIFKMLTSLLAFFVILPLLPSLLKLVNLSDPLYSLVAFNSLFNFIGLLLFLPLLRQYSHWIESLFSQKTETDLLSISTDIPEATCTTLKHHTYNLYLKAISLNLRNLDIDISQLSLQKELGRKLLLQSNGHESFESVYEAIKQREGEISQVILTLQQQPIKEDIAVILNCFLDVVRGISYSCKTLKDIRDDLISLRHEPIPLCTNLYKSHTEYHCLYYAQVLLLLTNHSELYLEEQLEQLTQNNNQHHEDCNQLVQHHPFAKDGLVLYSSLLNINHGIHHSAKNLLLTLKPWSKLYSLITDVNRS